MLFLEAWRAVDRAYVDRSFNGQSWFRYRENALKKEAMARPCSPLWPGDVQMLGADMKARPRCAIAGHGIADNHGDQEDAGDAGVGPAAALAALAEALVMPQMVSSALTRRAVRCAGRSVHPTAGAGAVLDARRDTEGRSFGCRPGGERPHTRVTALPLFQHSSRAIPARQPHPLCAALHPAVRTYIACRQALCRVRPLSHSAPF